MSGVSTKGLVTIMDKTRRAFQFYLSPANERDQAILVWLERIPRRQRAGNVKALLLKTVQHDPVLQPVVKKKGMFFRLYLHHYNEQDREIAVWLQSIPLNQRSRQMKTILYQGIAIGLNQKPAAKPSDPGTITVARGLFSSFRKKASSET